MTVIEQAEMDPGQRILLWPGTAAVTLQWVIRFGTPLVAPQAAAFSVIGGMVGGLAVLVWWAFFSRVPPLERWGAVALMIAAVAATPRILDPSIVGGMMGMMFPIYVIPGLSLALVGWAVISHRFANAAGRAALAAAILAACGVWALVRTDGITGDGQSQFAWRWTRTPEQKFLVRTDVGPAAPMETLEGPAATTVPSQAATPPKAAPPTVESPPRARPTGIEWPGFRGPHRDGAVTGLRIRTDWASSPPVPMWRRPVGPGWSSFAVRDGLLYTQEQRGDFEVVACYNAGTGKPVWTHKDAARFWESNGGAGPRGTPALHGGCVYTLGATGILNALDAGSGAVVWTRNAASDTGAKLPGWGFSSSPLVVDDEVIVAASGRLAAYGLATGHPRWKIEEGGASYSSPQMLTEIGKPLVRPVRLEKV